DHRSPARGRARRRDRGYRPRRARPRLRGVGGPHLRASVRAERALSPRLRAPGGDTVGRGPPGGRPSRAHHGLPAPRAHPPAFRQHELTCGPPEAIFRTSGTTAGPATRGAHLVPHLDLYRASALAAFREFVLPDGVRPSSLFLLPSPARRPESSLVCMCAWVG